ncbi:MAG TPA: hypothetical protein VGJ66_18155 [Pyrinomonadaceae bacterium]|jgi:hypothetical protein
MRGYFTGLAKQSGLAIGDFGAGSPKAKAHQDSSSRVSSGRAGATLPVETALHVDSVELVNPSAESGGSRSLATRSSSFQRGTGDQDASATGGGTPADIQGTQSPGVEAKQFPDSSNQQIVERSETKFICQGSSQSSTFVDNAGEGSFEADGPASETGEQSWAGQGGVVRVGERGRSDHQKSTLNRDLFSRVAPAPGRQGPDFSIPLDYLDDIREWLSSPPDSIEAIQTNEADSNPEKAFTASQQDVRLLVPNLSDRSSQNDIQEFSLSIGSISIVVEQPAQPPIDRPASRQPVENQAASAQPGARDTFALSRSYFRGF